MKMTTYLQAAIFAHGDHMRRTAILDVCWVTEDPYKDMEAFHARIEKRARQSIKFYDKVAKLTHLADAYRVAIEYNVAVSDLSPRELDVVKCVAEGMSDKEIASRLSISHKTVKTHLMNIAGKLCAAGRVDIVMESLRRGLIDIPEAKPCLPF